MTFNTQVALLNNNKNSEYCAPLTSFDWNESEPSSLIDTSSIDTTCTIWDLSRTSREDAAHRPRQGGL